MDATAGEDGPAARIETLARFQAGFLSSKDIHRFIQVFIYFGVWMPKGGFSWIFKPNKCFTLGPNMVHI